MRSVFKKSGFTLLETIVSITLLALIALMITRVFNESSKAVDRGSSDVALDETARLLLDVFEQDISQALIRTNVAFRVYPASRNGSLYFISTAVRTQHDNIPRDMAPMRISRIAMESDSTWNGYVEIETAFNASANSDQTIYNLIAHSSYYMTNSTQSVPDFGTVPDRTFRGEYTRPAEESLDDHAVLSFLDIRVNGDPNWNNNNPVGLPDPENMPDFVDISLGLVSAREMKMAIRLNASQRIENNERIYSRRIYLWNQGVRKLAF